MNQSQSSPDTKLRNCPIIDGFYTWQKGENFQLGRHFQTCEVSCKCKNEECLTQKASLKLVERADGLRECVNSPMRVHSGYRCKAKQQAIRESGLYTVVAEKPSTHELGEGWDVSVSSLTPQQLRLKAAHFFKAIGTAINFLHLDTRDDKLRRWNY